MTTIAFDGNTLATDRRSSRPTPDNVHCPKCEEDITHTGQETNKIYLPKGASFKGSKVYAIASMGAQVTSTGLKTCIAGGIDLDTANTMLKAFQSTGSFTPYGGVAVWCEKGFYEVMLHKNKLKVTEITKFPYTVGSGGDLAKMAMELLGADPDMAVAIASRYDIGSGGGVNLVMLDDAGEPKRSEKTISAEEMDLYKHPKPVPKPAAKPRAKTGNGK